MTHHLHTPDAAEAATPQQLTERVAALELYLQQLVFMLDVKGALDMDAMTHWIELCRTRMTQTGSVPTAHAAALGRLHKQVAQ